MRKKALIVVVIAALFGAALSILSTTQHLRIQREGLIEESFCAVSETINCDIVNASSYSEFLGVPIAWWGLCYYLLIGGMALFALLSRRDRRATVAVAWFLSLGGIAYSAFLAYISFFVLGVLCIECLGMYAANIAFAIALFVALGVPLGGIVRFVIDYLKALFGRPSNLPFKPKVVSHAIAVALVYGLGWLVILNILSDMGVRQGPTVDELTNAFFQQSLHDITVDPEWAVWGNPNAKVTIVEFSEYQCPFCRLSAFNVKPYLQQFKDDVRYYFVNFPLDSACNDQMSRPMHPLACFAGKAAICAQERGDFWSFHDELFRNQRELSRDFILGLAEKRGWDRDEFLACIDSPEVDARIKRELAEGHKIYVTGTPTLFLDGRKLKYWRNPQFVQQVVREEIKRAKRR